jgi:hypothetical protein
MAEKTTCFVAAPIVQRDDGALLEDDAVECCLAEAAVEMARQMARAPGYVGAWAFSRTGNPASGWYEDPEVLCRFGSI